MRILWVLFIIVVGAMLAGCARTTVEKSVSTSAEESSHEPIDTIEQAVWQSQQDKLTAEDNIKLALDLMGQQRYPLAKEKLLTAERLDPKLAAAYYTFGYYYTQIKDTESAKKYYAKAVEIAPHDPLALNAYGVFLCQTGEYKKSLTYFQQAVGIPNYTEAGLAYQNAGICTLKIPDVDLALGYLAKAIDVNPKLTESYLLLAEINYHKAAYHVAENYLVEYNQLQKPSRSSLALAVAIANKLGEHDKAATLQLKLDSLPK